MLTIQSLREDKDRVIQALSKRHVDATSDIEQVLEWDAARRQTQANLDDLLAQSNALSREIGGLMREGKKEAAEAVKGKTAEMREQTTDLKHRMHELEASIQDVLCTIPNTPHADVVAGKSAEDNIETARWGEIPTLHAGAMPHWELADRFKLIDFELGSKVTGAGFPFYRGKGAKLQRGLIRMFLDCADEAGYEEFIPLTRPAC